MGQTMSEFGGDFIDTAGAGDYQGRDAEHMLDIYKMLIQCKTIMFHKNVVMVVTGYQLDGRWQEANTENGVGPTQVLERLAKDMENILGICVPLYTIDSKATPKYAEDYAAADLSQQINRLKIDQMSIKEIEERLRFSSG
ncbi:hypothetical protein PROFUN_15373 [Planoprotostelium fungivorum]|uniref:Uncharacterized protein n=1 Tax=Planoprotostelium fungivorum TaxID=1890364 RepID=A0A2P6MWT5_9EUKA|nr:hypothetical protein PROFUN_15373 [Planoprotostelium fungivorum]